MPKSTRREFPATAHFRDYVDVYVYVPTRIAEKLNMRWGWTNVARVEGTDIAAAVREVADQTPWAARYRLDVCVARVEETRTAAFLIPSPW